MNKTLKKYFILHREKGVYANESLKIDVVLILAKKVK